MLIHDSKAIALPSNLLELPKVSNHPLVLSILIYHFSNYAHVIHVYNIIQVYTYIESNTMQASV